MIEVINADAIEWLRKAAHMRVAFADIPDNIGLDYDGVSDRKSPREYRDWVSSLVKLAFQKTDIFWLSHNIIHHPWIVGMMAYNMPGNWSYRQIIWRYTFGQYNDRDFTSGYRPIALMMREGVQLDYDKIRTVSARMQMGDKRAAGLRVPDDVWEYPRVVGNSKERRSWHPTQHPEDLMQRIILLSCNETGFCDLFAGSGTSGIVCKRLEIPCKLIELSSAYAARYT